MIELDLQDNEYPFEGFEIHRLVVRGIVLDESGFVALHRIARDDAFGKQEYYETPGGGVDEGETLEEALMRECGEELGEKVAVLQQIGIVRSAYNLIKTENENHYFICKKIGEGEKHFVSEGDFLIQETVWVPLEEGIKLLEAQPNCLVSALVKARELPMFREALRVLNSVDVRL